MKSEDPIHDTTPSPDDPGTDDRREPRMEVLPPAHSYRNSRNQAAIVADLRIRMADLLLQAFAPLMLDERFVNQLADAVAARVSQRLVDQSKGLPRIAPRWLDLKHAAELMHTTPAAVRGMARAKLFPVKKMGGRVMVDIKDLETAFAENTSWLGR